MLTVPTTVDPAGASIASANTSTRNRWLNISAFSVLGEFVPVSFILRFRLSQKLDEFGRLSDAVQISITLVARIKVKTGDGGFSQPFDGFCALTFERIDAGDVVGGVMIERVFVEVLINDERNLGFRGAKISVDG